MYNAIRIGLTGPMGAGKSAVAEIWKNLGAGVVSGDDMGRLALGETDTREALVNRFGPGILDSVGAINRRALAEIGFASDENQKDLTRITFPAIHRLAGKRMLELSENHPAVIFDAALIFEWGIQAEFEYIITVTAPLPVLIRRACRRLKITAEDARRRILTQIPPDEKAKMSDFVIINNADFESLKWQAITIWGEIWLNKDKNEPDFFRGAPLA